MRFTKFATLAAIFVMAFVIIVGAVARFWSSVNCISERDAKQAVIDHLGGADAYSQEHGAYVKEIPFMIGGCALMGRSVTSYEHVWFVTNSGKVIG